MTYCNCMSTRSYSEGICNKCGRKERPSVDSRLERYRHALQYIAVKSEYCRTFRNDDTSSEFYWKWINEFRNVAREAVSGDGITPDLSTHGAGGDSVPKGKDKSR